MRRDKQLIVRTYPVEEHARYKGLAAVQGVSMAEWCRRAMSSQADLDEVEIRERQREEEKRQFYASLGRK